MRKCYNEIGLIVMYGSVLAHSNHIYYIYFHNSSFDHIFSRVPIFYLLPISVFTATSLSTSIFFSLKCIAQWNNSNFSLLHPCPFNLHPEKWFGGCHLKFYFSIYPDFFSGCSPDFFWFLFNLPPRNKFEVTT